jgi:DNA-binding transcriptional regulator YbjK
MMQANELQQRFSQVEQSIHHAAECCRSSMNVPMDLKDSIQQMDQRTSQAKQIMQSQDENQVQRCIDELEQLGDRAKDACEQSRNVDGELRDAIMQAHRELSDLKHQLH